MLKYSPVVKEGIPRLKRGSKEYNLYWYEQIRRCKEGYKPSNGVLIPGAYYFYLNFCSILYIDKKTNRKQLNRPWYRDMDHEYFDAVYDCKKNGQGLIVLKARDKGFSYMNANIALYEATFFPYNEIGIGAPTPKYVSALKIKVVNAWSKLPPELKLRKDLKDSDDMIKFGYKVKEDNGWIEKGMKSIIHFRCLDNPDAFRGERFGMGFFDEFGEQREGIRTFMASEACFNEGSIRYGIPIVGGTANTMKKSDDFLEMWYNHEKYDLRQFFVPCTKVLYGFFNEKTGKSDLKGAEEFYQKKREKLRQAKDKTAYYLHLQEHPLVPEDAFMQSNKSPFDLEKINEQMARIISNKSIQGMIQVGDLDWTDRRNFKVKFTLNPDGKYKILQHPQTHIRGLDIGAVDSYYNEEAPTSPSKGCAMIFRRWHTGMGDETNLPIAMYVDRPYTKEEWYENNLKLFAYYNAKALVEYTDDGYFSYFNRMQANKFLKERPSSADAPYSRVQNRYGIHMKGYQKNLVVDLIDDYIKKHCENIYFLELLKDLSDFGIKNTDMAMTFGIILIHDLDNANLRIFDETKENTLGDNYLLPTYIRDERGNIRVVNNSNRDVTFKPNNPLGLLNIE